MTYKNRLIGAISRLANVLLFTKSRNTIEKRRKYATNIVNRVLRIVGDCEGGKLKIASEFDQCEADLAYFALRTLCDCGIVRKKVRYYIEKTPEAPKV